MRRNVFLFLGLLFALTVLLSVPQPQTYAATESIWDGEIVLESDELWADDDFSYKDCVDGTISQDVYYRPRSYSNTAYDNFLYPTDQRVEEHEECLVQNKLGLFGGNYWSPDGNPNKVLEIPNVDYTPVPSGNAVIIHHSSGTYPYGSKSASINYNLQGIGVLKVGYKGRSSSLRAYRQWEIINRAEALQYSDNTPILIRKWAFSSNGRYAVAALTTGAIIRINLDTQEIQPFAQLSTSGRGWVMRISNDGDYALVHERNTTPPTFFDLTSCNTQYQKGLLPESSDISGCTSRNLSGLINSIYSGAASGYLLLGDFEPNNAGFTIGVAVNDAEGSRIQKLKFKPENYVSQAQGYLAMGDSFSSGEGDTEGGTWYEPGTDEQGDKDTFAGRNLCHLSRRSYPYLMAIELGYLSNNTTSPPADGLFHSVACSGAKIHNVIGIVGEKQDDGIASDFAITDNQYRYDRFQANAMQLPGTEKQFDRFIDKTLPDDRDRSAQNPEIITIGIGGNDVGFASILKACLLPGTCEFAVPSSDKMTELITKIAANKSRLVSTYKQIRSSSPEARVYVHGYPKIVDGESEDCAANVRLDGAERFFVVKATHYINEVIRAAASEAGVYYINVEDIFNNKKLCSDTAHENIMVNGVTAGNDVNLGEGTTVFDIVLSTGICFRNCIGNETYHPTSEGHVVYKEVILSQTSDLQASLPNPAETQVPVPDVFFGLEAISNVNIMNDTKDYPKLSVEKVGIIESANKLTNTVKITQSDLLPNSTIRIEIHSDPVLLGTYQVDETGLVEVEISLPEDLEPGYHEIHIIGYDIFGNEVDHYQSILVGESTTDFDGDGVLNEGDSCPLFPNAFIDEDEDGIDDACDTLLAQNTDGEEEQPIKGQPNPETVAGTGEELSNVLGANTEVLGEDLQSTGDSIGLNNIFIGVVLVLGAFVSTKTRASLYKVK